MNPEQREAIRHRSDRFLARLSGAQEGSVALAAQMSAADVPDLLDEIGRLQRDVDRLQCRSVYMECEKYDRRCVDDRSHGRNGSRLHMNRAGFAWSDKEAAESLDRVYPALPAPSPSNTREETAGD